MTTTTYGPLSMLTVAEAADELHISRDAVYRLCREGTVICRTVGAKGKTLHVLYASITAWAYDLPQPTAFRVSMYTCRCGYIYRAVVYPMSSSATAAYWEEVAAPLVTDPLREGER